MGASKRSPNASDRLIDAMLLAHESMAARMSARCGSFFGMTWSISASGSKASVLSAIKSQTHNPELSDAAQFERAKAHILSEVEAAPNESVAVSAHGHADAENASESISIKSTH